MSHHRLTERERNVFKILVENQTKTNEEIGKLLNLSPHTVAAYIRSILVKLHLGSRYEILTYALKNGLCTLSPNDKSIIFRWS
ncbi:response regulator transcription factor [Thermoflexibacter ruber]|uniref:Regulatory protein, luxR family n=1 Tax=Thermoflexibacter ruber TaxID=1003 RepID=A0A1I2BU87_9BACT|nr:LuxR C-terminal-related transcriptional regulator [Thermoflexibacter ruber]SFE59624.1 regulatory protein, luxR family [Thermoflexibacter ruber]